MFCPMWIKFDRDVDKSYYLFDGIRNSKSHNLLKGKAIPLEAWTSPEGPRRLRLLDFKTIGTLRP